MFTNRGAKSASTWTKYMFNSLSMTGYALNLRDSSCKSACYFSLEVCNAYVSDGNTCFIGHVKVHSNTAWSSLDLTLYEMEGEQ